MDLTLRIPDDLARRLGGDVPIERRALEALALEAYRSRQLDRHEVRDLLGFSTGGELDSFFAAHGIFGTYTHEDLQRDRDDLRRAGFAEE